MADNTPQEPRYYRMQLVFSDRDRDLKQWILDHPDRVGSTVRQALRAWLVAAGELSADAAGSSHGQSLPNTGRRRGRKPEPGGSSAGYIPPVAAAPRPAPTIGTQRGPISQPPPAPAPAVAAPSPVSAPAAPQPQASEDGPKPAKDRSRLGRMFGDNKGFD